MRRRQRIPRTLRIFTCSLLSAAFAVLPAAVTARADTLVFHATHSGRQTLDDGEGGGNPFASALVELLRRPSLTLSQLPLELQQLTAGKSRNFQSVDGPVSAAPADFSIVPPGRGENRVALVMVISDYARSGGAPSLPGAKHDAGRIAAALTQAGFTTEIALDLGLSAMRDKLGDFRKRSAVADAAVVYTTGHGVEVGGTVFLVPGDYPIAQRNAALASRALPLSEIAGSLAARRVNLVFYGGCRDDPLGP